MLVIIRMSADNDIAIETKRRLHEPDDKFISLEISLLHFKIDAKSAALRVNS